MPKENSPLTEGLIPAAESGVPAERWQHVHIITPLLETWRTLVALLAFVTYQNAEVLRDLYTNASEVRELMSADTSTIFGTVPVWGYAAAIVILFFMLISAYTYLSWKKKTFALGDDAVWLRSGLLQRQQRHARYERIQAVDIIHPFLGRIFGLGQLKIEVAGGANSHMKIGYLASDELEALRQRVLTLAAGKREGISDPGQMRLVSSDTAGSLGEEHSPGVPAHSMPLPAADDNQQKLTGPGALIPVEERPLYSVSLGLQLRALVRSSEVLTSAGILVIVFLGIIAVGVLTGEWAVFSALFAVAPIFLGLGGVLWAQVNKNFAFRAFATPEGIRIKRGMTEARSQSIPPKRVHAIEVSQPLLWRKPGWYKVRILQAGYAGENQKETYDFLLPMGGLSEAQLAMWLVVPDLGVDAPLELINAALQGNNAIADPYFHGVKRSVRWIDWFSWKRRAFAITKTVLITRDGWLRRRAIIIPFERLQSLSVHQGPLERKLGVATVNVETVPGNMDTRIHHVAVERALLLTPELIRLSAYRRSLDEPNTWNERMSGDLTPFESLHEQQAAIPSIPVETTSEQNTESYE